MSDFDQAAAKLKRLDGAITAVLPQGAEQAAKVLVKAVKRKAPRGATGDLVKSVKATKEKGGKNEGKWRVGVGVFYAWFVEYGHAGPKAGSPKTLAHPFFRPAIHQSQSAMNGAEEKVVLAASRKVTG